jgi:hypothetical protein
MLYNSLSLSLSLISVWVLFSKWDFSIGFLAAPCQYPGVTFCHIVHQCHDLQVS